MNYQPATTTKHNSVDKFKQRNYNFSEKKLREARAIKLKLRNFIQKEKKSTVTKKIFMENKFNEETNYNKLLKLKREEIEMENEYNSFKNQMKSKLEVIREKENDYVEKYEKVMQNYETKEMEFFEKLESVHKENIEKCKEINEIIKKKKIKILKAEKTKNKFE